ncbi:MAG: winged helix-turn-helix domain-containing protein [Pseudomonadota bacterium]
MSRRPGATRAEVLTFGAFRLLPAQKLLLQGETTVRIGDRALTVLTALVERAGDVVPKEELLARAWPDTTVVEANLRVHVAGLRKLLGDGQTGARYIVNVIGRGYCFVAPVTRSEVTTPLSPSVTGRSPGLPKQLERMIGRADTVATLSAQLPRRRFVTIVGPGGIGKTTVAIAVAERMAASYRDGAWFVDLARLTNPLLVPSALSSVLGLAVQSEDPVPNLIAFLRDKQILIVLDNCEHVIESAASAAESILGSAPQANILATSREPMGAEGETVQRLAPLRIPPRAGKLTATLAMTFSAVQLFIERAATNLDGFEMSDADAPIVADICSRLDGLPLAIELAASRIDAFGLRGLATLLNDRFQSLTHGRRTALPRHKTLRATLDWSYGALTDPERLVLRRLAIFATSFTLESASAVASGPGIAAPEVVDHLANLIAKSLVVADIGSTDARYRLLSTTRTHALQKLSEAGEFESLSRRHAEHYRDLIERAEAEREYRSAPEWLTAYGDRIDDLRAALGWAFSPAGDVALGVALTIASVPLWTHLSLNEECRACVAAALSSLYPNEGQRTHDKLRLLAALGGALMYTRGSAAELTRTWRSALAIANSTGNTDYQLRSLWGLWADTINRGENRSALGIAEEFGRVATASADVAGAIVSDRMIGYSLYILGEPTKARSHVERMLNRYVRPANRSHIVRFQFDQRIMARIPLASVLWLQGFPDQAMAVVETNIDEAQEIDHAISLSYALLQSACLIALYVGDLAAVERFLAMLLDGSSRHAAQPWDLWGRCFKGVLLIKQGDPTSGARMLGAALAEFPENAFHMRYVVFLGELAGGLASAGQVGAGLAMVDRALGAAWRCEENWCLAELLRIKGEILLKQGGAEAAASGENCFREALSWARRQDALSWELRAATSCARLWRDQGRADDARALLGSTYDRFTEGFSTRDLVAAQVLLDELP